MKLSLFLQTQGLCLADGFHRLGVTKTLLTHMESVEVHACICIQLMRLKVDY